MNTTDTKKERLASLDILRGFDLFLLVFFQPVFLAFLGNTGLDWMQPLCHQLDHEVWNGFRFWDLVMPLFLFMTGASMPFSFSKYQGTRGDWVLYRKIIKRFIVLFILGMVVQGNLLGLDWKHLYIYTNTLQAIASGYLFTALIFLNFSISRQILIGGLLLVIYALPFLLTGDYTPEGNFANWVDQLLLGRFRGDPSYTWIWSTLTFTVTVLLGSFAGRIMKKGTRNKKMVVARLWCIAVLLMILAGICSIWMPVNKRIWSVSMTLLSGGYCFMLMGLFYYWIDYKGHRRGLEWLKFYGMNSITAYLLGEVINFRSIAQSVSYGLQPYLGDYYPAWLTFVNFLILFFILRWMYRHQIFLKI